MRRKELSIASKVAGLLFAVGLLSAGAVAQDGYNPYGGLVSDAAGNLYGMTSDGGAYDYYGMVFELTAVDGWPEESLFSFDQIDGYTPYAGLIFDSSGNLYGTTRFGGAHGEGTVFELIPKSDGTWKRKVLHNFNPNGEDGTYPTCALIFDSAGNLYGSTGLGGAHNNGTVFKLTPVAGAGWSETVLHNFNPNGKDGISPYAGLVSDSAGNLYGTTPGGGAHSYGTAFELTPKTGGGWTEKVLHNFNGEAGAYPKGSLTVDKAGNLYGTTIEGGAYGDGVVFELTPEAGGGWTEKALHNFNPSRKDGVSPYSGLIFDAAGDLYGTTIEGGGHNGGTVFELSPGTGGGWTETVLHRFDDKSTDGNTPYASLIFDAAGNLYGTTYSGGVYGAGTVFELTPQAGDWTETILHNFSDQ
jgi:uncharacterized repeat protein (TIGR03803 family)